MLPVLSETGLSLEIHIPAYCQTINCTLRESFSALLSEYELEAGGCWPRGTVSPERPFAQVIFRKFPFVWEHDMQWTLLSDSATLPSHL